MRTVAQKYIEAGRIRGKVEGKVELLKTMIANGNSIEEVSKITKLSVTGIRKLLKIQ